MKYCLLLFLFLSFNSWSQDYKVYFNSFDTKVYSLKNKGVQDFVVDIRSSKLTKQLNDQMIFGKVDDVFFRTYWTANPERIAIDIHGLPEGFKEIKEELKLSVSTILENILPLPLVKKFAGYQFMNAQKSKEFIARDTSGIATIPAFTLRFNNQDCLTEVIGKKPVGSLIMTPVYEKESFSDGKWVLKSMNTINKENGQSLSTMRQLHYGSVQGVGVLSKIEIRTEQNTEGRNSKSLIFEENIEFGNYKINSGAALKYFLSEGQK